MFESDIVVLEFWIDLSCMVDTLSMLTGVDTWVLRLFYTLVLHLVQLCVCFCVELPGGAVEVSRHNGSDFRVVTIGIRARLSNC